GGVAGSTARRSIGLGSPPPHTRAPAALRARWTRGQTFIGLPSGLTGPVRRSHRAGSQGCPKGSRITPLLACRDPRRIRMGVILSDIERARSMMRSRDIVNSHPPAHHGQERAPSGLAFVAAILAALCALGFVVL